MRNDQKTTQKPRVPGIRKLSHRNPHSPGQKKKFGTLSKKNRIAHQFDRMKKGGRYQDQPRGKVCHQRARRPRGKGDREKRHEEGGGGGSLLQKAVHQGEIERVGLRGKGELGREGEKQGEMEGLQFSLPTPLTEKPPSALGEMIRPLGREGRGGELLRYPGVGAGASSGRGGIRISS